MKKINFINALSLKKQYEIRHWFWITSFLCLVVVLVGFYLVIGPYLSYCQLYKEVVALRQKTKNSIAVQNEHVGIQKEHDLFHGRKIKIDAYQVSQKNPSTYIAGIINACDKELTLESIKFTKDEVEIALICADLQCVYTFVKELEKAGRFKPITIISVQKSEKDNNVSSALKGKMIF